MKKTSALNLGGLLIASLTFLAAPVSAVEIMRWERLPLAVPLTVGHERIIFLDQDVRVGVPASLQNSLRVQSANGAIYLLASSAIEPTRIQLQSSTTGELILVDIAASAGDEKSAHLEPVKIVRGHVPSDRYADAPGQTPQSPQVAVDPQDTKISPSPKTPVPVVLTRYAAQTLYAPLRTVEPVEGISQVQLRSNLDLSSLAPSWPVEAKALGAWRLDDYWVTAVRLRNLSAVRIDLDPRALQGDLATATFQHEYLGTRGDASDTTVVYLVTKGKELAKAVLPSLSQVNSASNLRGGSDGDK